jgi:hypothetical protein
MAKYFDKPPLELNIDDIPLDEHFNDAVTR